MDTDLILALNASATHWQLLAELPFTDLAAVYEQVRKLRHVMVKSFDVDKDSSVAFVYRGFHFRIIRYGDHIEILVNDPQCPADILLEPLSRLISPLSRCRVAQLKTC